MTKRRSTKRALLLSALSLLMCVSMLIGSTFAWFTDSVTSAGNKIQAGNLKIDLEIYDKESTAANKWHSIKESKEAIFTYQNWEPGYVDAKLLKVENEGSLALKWKAAFVSATELSILADVIDVFVKPGATEAEFEALTREDLATWTNAGTVRQFLGGIEASTYGTLEAKESANLGIALKMRETAGNEYQNRTIGAFDIKILATQYTFEEDSFNDQYDKDAAYPATNMEVSTGEAFAAACKALKAGDTITLVDNLTLTEETMLPAGVILNGNGKQINGSIYAGGDLTIAGHVKVTGFSASYYNRTITIEPEACLEVTGTGRMSVAYGNTFNITGNISDAKTTDKTTVQPSLIIPGGISITGGNDATVNVTNAYVKIGSTSSKNNAANGTFTMNFTNSIVDFTNQFTFSEPTNGNNPTFNVTFKDSVVTTGTKLCAAAPNTKIVFDNSQVALGNYLRNSGTIELKNKSTLSGATIQFGENGGNNGKIIVDDSELVITASSTGHAFDGKGIGSIKLSNGATAYVDYYKDMTITCDATSSFTGTQIN